MIKNPNSVMQEMLKNTRSAHESFDEVDQAICNHEKQNKGSSV